MTTELQKKAIDILVEKGGETSVSQAMIEAGYSPETAHTPGKLTNSKAFKELTEDLLPNYHLLEKNRQFLDTPKVTRYYKKGELETEIEEISPIAIKALELAYRIKGLFVERSQNTNLNINTTPVEISDKIKTIAKEVVKKLQAEE